jgi:hypothetical protein
MVGARRGGEAAAASWVGMGSLEAASLLASSCSSRLGLSLFFPLFSPLLQDLFFFPAVEPDLMRRVAGASEKRPLLPGLCMFLVCVWPVTCFCS